MKKLYLVASLLLFVNFLSRAQCSYTHGINGNTLNVNYAWAIVGINQIDSVRLDWGDGTSVTQVPPAGSPVSHTYTTGGTYNVCLTRYMSIFNVPNSTMVCTYCQMITIGTVPLNCIANADFTSVVTGSTAAFTNTSTCTGCVSNNYVWTFGDGSAPSTLSAPSHTYAMPGVYNVCLKNTGIDSLGVTCIDSTCHTVTILPTPVNCVITAGWTPTVNGLSVAFANTSSCVNCLTTNNIWYYGDGSAPEFVASPTHTFAGGTYNVCLVVTGLTSTNNFCIDSSCNTVNVATGLLDQPKHQLEVYPNPTKDVLYIANPSLGNTSEIKVLDITGRVVLEITAKNNQEPKIAIAVNSLTKGMYFLKVDADNKRYLATFSKD